MGMYSPYDFRKGVDRYKGNFRVKKSLIFEAFVSAVYTFQYTAFYKPFKFNEKQPDTSVKKNKILIFGPSPPPNGGARISFNIFLNYIRNISKNILIYHVDIPVRIDRQSNPPGKVNFFRTLFLIFRYVPLLFRCNKVIVFSSRKGMWSYGILILIISKLTNKKCYLRFFGGFPCMEIKNYKYLRKIYFYLISFADKIIIQTKTGARDFPGYLSDKIRIVPGYRDTPENTKRKIVLNEIFSFVSVGSLTPLKGINTLLDAFNMIKSENKYKNVQLQIYGQADQSAITRINYIDGANYYGILDNKKVYQKISECDAFIFPSMHKSEGHPGVIIESLFAGIPIISTNLPGPSEILEHGKSALLFEPGNAEQLADSMKKLIFNKDVCKKLSLGAKEVSLKFEAKYVLPNLVKCFDLNHSMEI